MVNSPLHTLPTGGHLVSGLAYSDDVDDDADAADDDDDEEEEGGG